MNGLSDCLSKVQEILLSSTGSIYSRIEGLMNVSSRAAEDCARLSEWVVKEPVTPSVTHVSEPVNVDNAGTSASTENFPPLPSQDRQTHVNNSLVQVSNINNKQNQLIKSYGTNETVTLKTMILLGVPSMVSTGSANNSQSAGNQVQRPSKSTMIGASTTSTLKAAKTMLIKNVVFTLRNIDANFSTEDVTAHVTSFGVQVISCFELEKRSFQPVGNKQLRVCIVAADKNTLLYPSNWASCITIKDWVFYSKPSTSVAAAGTGCPMDVHQPALPRGKSHAISSADVSRQESLSSLGSDVEHNLIT